MDRHYLVNIIQLINIIILIIYNSDFNIYDM
jgi:hypothetical protein